MKNISLKNQLSFLACLAILVLFSACPNTDVTEPGPDPIDEADHIPPQETKAAAETGLPLLSAIIDEFNHADFGFESHTEAANVSLGTPIAVYNIDHDVLQTFESEDEDPKELTEDFYEVLFPVLSNGQIRSSIGVKKKNNVWEFTELGNVNFTQPLYDVRSLHASQTGRQHEDYFIINMHSVYLTFIAHRSDGNLMMAPVHTHNELDLIAEQFKPAQEIMELVVSFSQDHPGGGEGE